MTHEKNLDAQITLEDYSFEQAPSDVLFSGF